MRRLVSHSLRVTAGAFLVSVSAFCQNPSSATTPPPGQRQSPGWAAQQKAQASATAKLAASPRRSEWVTIQNGNRTLKGWVVYPARKGKAPVVLVLHEVFGLTDSTRNTADEIAAMGYIAITPDLLSGYGPNSGNSDSFEPPLSASQVSITLPDGAVNSDIDAWADYGEKLPRAEKKFDIVGLSWSGGAAFRYITYTHRKDLKALCIFYDVGPPRETQHFVGAPATLSVAGIQVPVYGFYPSQDARVMKSLPATKDAMAVAAKRYDPVVYQDAEHAYMRIGEDPANPNPANAQALKESLARLDQILANTLRAR